MAVRILHARERTLRLAEGVRERYSDLSDLDAIARREDIVLVRSPGLDNKEAGFAYIEYVPHSIYLESLAHPGELVRVWGRESKRAVRSIVINPYAGVPEREVFWHEYYHLFYSPNGIQRNVEFEHSYSTEGVLHNIEERRADEFAAAVLVHPLEECEEIVQIEERFGVSRQLAICALKLVEKTIPNRERYADE